MCWPHGAYCTEFEQTTIQHNPQEDKPIDIIKEIGLPAALEQLAEECCELGQAALKLARKLRGENPTPKTLMECQEALQEELGDVLLCTKLIRIPDILGSDDCIDEGAKLKLERWIERLSEDKEKK
jgi:NTP pyrophosphatase (non-canonical NTP hydrolase)